jgi:hypothetical protein
VYIILADKNIHLLKKASKHQVNQPKNAHAVTDPNLNDLLLEVIHRLDTTIIFHGRMIRRKLARREWRMGMRLRGG